MDQLPVEIKIDDYWNPQLHALLILYLRGTVKKFVDNLYSLQTIWRNSVKFTHMALWWICKEILLKH